ncbi:unnamed protein product [Brassica oleracea var. botrytis]
MKQDKISLVKETMVVGGISQTNGTQDFVQKRVVDGKICVTVLSISAEVMRKLHEPEEEQQLERVTRFCVYLLNKTLSENSFSWKDTTSLRIHFSTSLGVSVKRLFNIFETAFKELNEMSPEGIVGYSKEPTFNLVKKKKKIIIIHSILSRSLVLETLLLRSTT